MVSISCILKENIPFLFSMYSLSLLNIILGTNFYQNLTKSPFGDVLIWKKKDK